MQHSPEGDRTVIIVLDPIYGEKLKALRNEPATWVVDTPVNRRSWDTAHMQNGSNALFSVTDPELRPPNLLAVLPDIADHFGPDTFPSNPYTRLRVIGLPLSGNTREQLQERGFSNCVECADGFFATFPIDTR